MNHSQVLRRTLSPNPWIRRHKNIPIRITESSRIDEQKQIQKISEHVICLTAQEQGHEDQRHKSFFNGHPVGHHHCHTVSCVWRCLRCAVAGLGSLLIDVDPLRGLDLHRGQPQWAVSDLLASSGAIRPLRSTDDGFHLRFQQHIAGVVVSRHQLWITALVGMVLHGKQLVSTLHLLFCQSACQGQSKALPRLDGIDMRITAHRALFTAMVGFAWLAFGPLLTG